MCEGLECALVVAMGRQPGSQAVRRRAAGTRHACRQARALNAGVAILSGAPLLEARRRRHPARGGGSAHACVGGALCVCWVLAHIFLYIYVYIDISI